MSARATMHSWAKLQNSAKNSLQKLGKFTHHTNGFNSLTDFENKDAITGNGNDVNLLNFQNSAKNSVQKLGKFTPSYLWFQQSDRF